MNAKLHIWHWVKNHIIMSQYSIQGPNGILRKKLRFLNNSCEKTNFHIWHWVKYHIIMSHYSI